MTVLRISHVAPAKRNIEKIVYERISPAEKILLGIIKYVS